MATMFLSNRYEMRKSYRGPSIDDFCTISLYLAPPFERRRFLEIDQPETIIALLTVNRRRSPSDDKSSHSIWPGEIMNRVYSSVS